MAAEQYNATLGKIRNQVAYMTLRHWTLYTRFYVCMVNEAKRERLLQKIRSDASYKMLIKKLHDVMVSEMGHIATNKCQCVICKALLN